MKSKQLDHIFDEGKDITEFLAWSNPSSGNKNVDRRKIAAGGKLEKRVGCVKR
ncbi:MAG: hypothetical protein ACRD1R_16950 [Acidobacteriota bacterium]